MAAKNTLRNIGIGATQLFTGKVIGRVIGLVGGLILLRFLSPEEYGLIAIAMATVAVFHLMGELNIGDATTRFIARYLQNELWHDVRSVAYVSLGFHIILGSSITFFIYVTAEPLTILVGKPEILELARISSFGILGTILVGYATGALLGLNMTKGYASIMILQEILSAILPIILVLQGLGVVGALIGMILAWIMAGVVGTAYVLIKVSWRKPYNRESTGFYRIFRELLSFSAPLWVANLLKAADGRYFGYIMAVFLTAQEAGNYAAALALFAPLSYVTFPVKEIMYPVFSRINPTTESQTLRKAFEKSVQYSTLLMIPLTVLMLLLASPTISLLIPRYSEGIFYLSVMLVFQLSYGLGTNYILRLLTAQGETRIIAWYRALILFTGVIGGILLVPTYKVVGLIIAQNSALLIPSFIVFLRAWKRFAIRPPLISVAPIYASASITGLIVYLLLRLPLGEAASIICGLSVGIPLYLLFTTLLKAVDNYDIMRLRTAFGHIPVFGILANRLLNFMEYVIQRMAYLH